MALADDIGYAERMLRELCGIVRVPPYVVAFCARFVAARNGARTADVADELRARIPQLARDAYGSDPADRVAARMIQNRARRDPR